MTQKVIDLCKKAADINYSAKYRQGNIISLSDGGRLIVTGDLHGHRRNFEKIVAFADLENNPRTHIVFQEILHGGREDEHGGCLSFELFFDVLRYQLRFPDQIHMILGNHDTAIIADTEILKSGKEIGQAMQLAMKRQFDDDFAAIDSAMREYLLSQSLAVKCSNKNWVSHSIPADRYIDKFDTEIFSRKLEVEDLIRPNSAYSLTWGRKHSQQTLTKFAHLLDLDILILGHQYQETGWCQAGDNLIIIASDHNHGCLVAFDPEKTYTIGELIDRIVPLASIA